MKFTENSRWYESVVLGYYGKEPVAIADGYGAVRCQDGDGLEVNGEGGTYYAYVEDGKWKTAHISNFGSCSAPPFLRNIDDTWEGDDELAEASGYNVAWE